MSGGSYDYICYKEIEDLRHYGDQIEAMERRLNELGYPMSAKKTRFLHTTIEAAFAALETYRDTFLKDIWHAVEWADSGDWSEEQACIVIERYERREV